MSMNENQATSQGAPQPSGPRPRALTLLSLVLVLVAILGVALLAWRRHSAEAADVKNRNVALAKGNTVQVVPVMVAPSEQTLTLPAEVRGWAQITLYAKVAGYVREIPVDKGTRVKKGDLLARLESPETDQAVAAARADLVLKRVLLQRTEALRPDGVVSQQDLDNAIGALRVSEATLKQDLAQQSYEVISAPFSGVVTARYVDVGALVPSGTGNTSTVQPVVDLADIDLLRVQVYVGQPDAARLQVGDSVSLATDSDPSHPIEAKVSRMSMGLDPKTRTMLVEADVDNRPPRLYPGQYVKATLHLRGSRAPLVPGEALTWRGDRLFVATVQNGQVRLQQVKTGDDSGRVVQILSGLQGGESVILNPSPELSDGDRVQAAVQPATPVAPPPPAPPGQASAPGSGAALPGVGLPAAR
ncbi:MAG: efflux RND transporter periplasmic adaptor subunit [Myxococcaceae bacterium]